VISYDAGHQREKLGDLSPVGLVLAPPVGLELVGKEEAFQSLVHLGDLLTEILHQGLEREQSPLEFAVVRYSLLLLHGRMSLRGRRRGGSPARSTREELLAGDELASVLEP
jgi:hypothetical protein